MKRSTKVVHVSTVHNVNDVRIFHKECRSLAQAGFEVILIAIGDVDATIDGVRIRSLRRDSRRRISRMTLGVLTALRLAWNERADVYHIHDAELLVLGLLLRLAGKEVIYDAHEDLVAQVASKHWIPRRFRRFIGSIAGTLEAIASKRMTCIIVANPKQATRFPANRTRSIQNFPMVAELNVPNASSYESRPMRVFYVGGISEVRGATQMVESMEIANRSLDCRLRLAGSFVPASLKGELESLSGWEYVDSLGHIDRPTVADELSQARLGLVVVHPVPNHLTNQPVKLFEYMAAGLPVIVSNIPNYAPFVERPTCGLLVDPLNPEEIAEAISWLLLNPRQAVEMGERGRRAVIDEFNWEREATQLVDLYNALPRLPAHG